MPNQDNTNQALPDGATYLNSSTKKNSGLLNAAYQHQCRQALAEALEKYSLCPLFPGRAEEKSFHER